MATRFIVVILLLVLKSSAQEITTSNKRVRQWSEWYNTDNPAGGDGDDETVNGIRKRGIEVCGGHAPIDASCRAVNQPDFIFNSLTSYAKEDSLEIQCTNEGLLCLNNVQTNRNKSCSDYEIRFECLNGGPVYQQNVMVIGVAAGLSVLVPIICVIIMHTVRLIKKRRQPLPETVQPDPEASGDALPEDLRSPPTYSELFGESFQSLLTTTISILHFPEVPGNPDAAVPDEEAVANHSRSRSGSRSDQLYSVSGDSFTVQSSEQTDEEETDESGETSETIVTRGSRQNSDTRETSGSRQINETRQTNGTSDQRQNGGPSRRLQLSRPTGMHLSIFDWVQQTCVHNDPTLPTPPPSYREALEILSACSFKKDLDDVQEGVVLGTEKTV